MRPLFSPAKEQALNVARAGVNNPRHFLKRRLLGLTTIFLVSCVGVSGWWLHSQIKHQAVFMEDQLVLEMHEFAQLQREMLRLKTLVIELPQTAPMPAEQQEAFDLQMDLVQSRFTIVEKGLRNRLENYNDGDEVVLDIGSMLNRWTVVKPLAKEIKQDPQNQALRKFVRSQLNNLELQIHTFALSNNRQRKQEYVSLIGNQQETLWLLLFLVSSFFTFALLFSLYAFRFNQVRQILLKELEKASITDDLTQIYNRRYFKRVLAQEWNRVMREQRYIALLLCDVDYFKRYNDLYGHQAGDECLLAIAQALCGTAHRSSDLVSRYGGEEFAIVLPNTTKQEATKFASRLHTQIAKLAVQHGASDVSDYVTVSIGIAVGIPVPSLEPDQAIAIADSALYEAKKKGRNQSCLRVFNLQKVALWQKNKSS